MKKYYLHRKPTLNGNFSVHREDCPFLAEEENRIYLGRFESCENALNAARSYIHKSSGCLFCSKNCSYPDSRMVFDWSKAFFDIQRN